MPEDIFDIVVIGGGPGGYVAAIRAAQLGMKVAVVEKRNNLGGVCLNEGCIPSKALLDSSELFTVAKEKFVSHGIKAAGLEFDLAKMMARKDQIVRKLTEGISFLLKKNKVIRFTGSGKLAGPRGDGLQVVAVTSPDSPGIPRLINGRHILLATGSEPVELPFLPFDGQTVVSSREALAFAEVPEHLLVVGGGYIGLELGSVWNRLGAKVTVVEMLPHILPNTDRQVADALAHILKKQGMYFLMESSVTGVDIEEGTTLVTVQTGDSTEELSCDRVLVAVGRKPFAANLGLAEAGIDLDEKGRVAVDKNYETAADGIYAIGDLIAGPMLAHKAMEEGVACVERLAGHASQVDYEFIPGVVYTWPEAASVGKTEEELKEANIAYSAGRFSFAANGRARCMEETDGFVKILARKDTGKVLGVHVVGPRASEMIAEAVTVISYGGSAQDIALTFHAHPTLSEAMKEAALDVEGRAIHV
ncbi:MAG: lpdA2 [Geobacteraceae bacterium]|nr:lpdA2 [Geobacteraceae bacterium]